MSEGRPAVFFDRDGTLIEEVGYLDRADRVELYPWTVDAIRALNRAGLPVIMVTNQSGVARGFFTEETLAEIHARIAELLSLGGAHIDAYYYCPHHPHGRIPELSRACECRKPGPGMVDRAVAEFNVDPLKSYVVGDRWFDVRLAQRVGAKGILVRTGYGAVEERRAPDGVPVDVVLNNVVEAASWVLADLRDGRGRQ